ncbi:NAD(P)H-quinone oxidoreductase [Luteimonas sp. MC1828]|uniref:NAD(P)H-quinone oxidoreductase n=1 Tax=Luteimonas sp. MC1828 TaxID=2799787 RepID=UPI0018F1FB2B|nr:NAD(P)H-quinone oxidoreductase [Luteimonas sp. MC1828]MBJ7573897.1 NAD(P)H-quinone oxidoreductase [Luteimonas sp. MC1828]
MSDTMTAIAIRGGSGPAEALHAVTVARPRPREGELLLRVRAAGVNRPDVLQRGGRYPPPPGAPDTLGLEVAGEVVEAAGRWKVGDRVCALLGGGGYAGYAVVDARHALPIPAGLDFVQAAALPETVFTVYANVFEHGALQPGETLLVHGATSGIGVAAIQMGKAAGARVVATARGAEKAAAARKLGADIAVDTSREEFGAAAVAAGGIDVAVDMVGAPYFAATLDALNTGGRIVYIAAQAGNELHVPVATLMRKRAVITGSMLRPRSADEKARLATEVERVVWPWIEAGRVRAVVDRTFPLEQAAEAHGWLESGRHTGKLVLVVA